MFKRQRFKIGDEVTAVDEVFGWGFINKGDKGVITEIRGDRYIVKFEAQSEWMGTESCFVGKEHNVLKVLKAIDKPRKKK